MAATTRFVPNAAGFHELLTSSEMQAMLHRKGEAVASAARSSAPVDTGEYRGSIVVVDDIHPTRAACHVASLDPDALVIEANTGNLARALDAAASG